MVYHSSSSNQSSKIPSGDWQDLTWGHLLVFFLKDKGFVSKTINEGSVDLDKFPARKVCQCAKKMKSSKATARHIKEVAGDAQATQINLMHHQCTESPSGKYKKRNPQSSKNMSNTRMQNRHKQVISRRVWP